MYDYNLVLDTDFKLYILLFFLLKFLDKARPFKIYIVNKMDFYYIIFNYISYLFKSLYQSIRNE